MSNNAPSAEPAFVNRTAVVLIILICLGIVIIPTLVSYLPVERSKWLIADARQTCMRAKGTDAAELTRASQLLQQAEQLNPEIVNSSDYVEVYFMVNGEKLDELGMLISKLDFNAQDYLLSLLSARLFKTKNYLGIVNLINQVLPKIEDRSPLVNNSFAYAAALGGIQLDEAELAINQALKEDESSALLDTKAWVLHKLNRNEEAIAVMQKAYQLQMNDLATASYATNWLISFRLSNGGTYSAPNSSELSALQAFATKLKASDPLLDISEKNLFESLQQLSASEVPEADREKIGKLKQVLQEPLAEGKESKKLSAEFEAFLRDVAVLRFHRAEIIRALGFNEVADRELQVIQQLGIEDLTALE